MFCEICGERIATLHFTKIINGQKNEFHLCEKCASENNNNLNFNFENFSFSVLSGLMNLEKIEENPLNIDTNLEKCLTCGLTFSEFKRRGKFGCNDCYKYFVNKLDPVFKRVHGNSRHNGKIPISLGSKHNFACELDKLKEELILKVNLEEFEEAAILRDKIKGLEEKILKDGDDSNGN